MQQYGLTVKKSLGQNFLIDTNIIHKIVAAAQLTDDCGVLEIGPGLGALTERLAQAARTVAAVEIDRRLVPVLQGTLAAYANVSIVHGDVLKLDLRRLVDEQFSPGQPISVVANLPYYITTSIMMKLLEAQLPLRNIVVMIQKEVADRFAAKPGSKQYGSLSVAVRYYAEPQLVMSVPNTVFIPQPNVESAVIKLTMRDRPAVEVRDPQRFFTLVQACFAQRRKTIANNLAHSTLLGPGDQIKGKAQDVLRDAGIDPMRRAETLSIEEFAQLFHTIDYLQDEIHQ